MNIIPAEMQNERFYLNGQRISKAKVAAQCKKILHGSELREPLVGDALDCVGSLLLSYRDNVGHPICIYVDAASGYGSRCFWYRNDEGGCDHFSYRAALQTQRGRMSRRVQIALRLEIWPQVREWRERNGITDPNIHADHIIPFSKICADFLTSRNMTLDDVVVTPVNDTWQIADHALANDWYAYHRDHAQFQALPAKENVAKGAQY